MKVLLSEQVLNFVRTLPPIPKQRVRQALRALESLDGDIKDLQHPLEDYCRLRAHQFRIIIKIHPEKVKCIFIEKRALVYEIFEQTFIGG